MPEAEDTAKGLAGWLSGVRRRLGSALGRLVVDVPDEMAYCEFNCAKDNCHDGDYTVCSRREQYELLVRETERPGPGPRFAVDTVRCHAHAGPDRQQALPADAVFNAERSLLMRQIDRRFGEAAAARAQPVIDTLHDQTRRHRVAECIVEQADCDGFLAALIEIGRESGPQE